MNLWTLGGLSLRDLLRRTARESWDDAVFGQGGRMAFYHFLALFPSLLVLLALAARIPPFGDPIKSSLQDLSNQVLPQQAAQLFQQMMNELNGSRLSGFQLLSVFAGATWASLNATWAMIYGLNTAYEVEEHRPWWKLGATIVGLSLTVAASICMALLLIFCGTRLPAHFHFGVLALRTLQWIILCVLVSLSLAIFYRFAPNLRDHEWSWSTPGAVCALILWIGCTVGARIYFTHISNYARSYGHLNSVVMLLLWLYLTNGAILIGGEMNSEIEKSAFAQNNGLHGNPPRRDRSGS